MLFAVLMAQRYDIFGFIASLADPRREISPAEAVALGCLGAICVWIFIARRFDEERSDAVSPDGAGERDAASCAALANQDPLTSLPNRRVLLEALDVAMNLPPVDGRSHAMFLLDLNGFKSVNDRYGHAVGDEVLQAVVERFRRAARSNEFSPASAATSLPCCRATSMRKRREPSATASSARCATSVSAGGAAARGRRRHWRGALSRDGDTVEKILRHADVAMYRAKSQPGSSLVFFERRCRHRGTARKATA